MKYVWTFSLYIKTRCVYMKTIINKFLLVIFFYFIFLNNFSVFYDPQLYPRLFTHELHPVSNVELQTVTAADHVYSALKGWLLSSIHSPNFPPFQLSSSINTCKAMREKEVLFSKIASRDEDWRHSMRAVRCSCGAPSWQ